MSEEPPNPYKAGPPVRESDFYNREALLDQVYSALGSSNVILLQGQRRIGKTSFLHQLHNFLMEKEGGNHLPFIFDMQMYIGDTLPQFQEHMARPIAKELKLPLPRLAEFESDSTLFQEIWLPQVFECLGTRQLVFLVDEFDNLGELKGGRATEELVPFIGSLVESEDQLKWVFTVGRHIDRLPTQYDQIITPTVMQYVIRFLDKEKTEQLICRPASDHLTFQPAAVKRIYQLTCGHPYLIQALCREIFDRVIPKRNVATSEDVDAVIAQTLHTNNDPISSIAQVPTIEEYVLAAIAQLTSAGQAASYQDVTQLLEKHHITLERGEVSGSLKHLAEWDLLVREGQGWRLTMELVRIWVEKNISLKPSLVEESKARAERRCEEAERARRDKDYGLALQAYIKALEYNPQLQEALRGLAGVYRITGNLGGRIDTLQKLYELNRAVRSELVEARSDYAQQCMREGKTDTATEQYEKLLELEEKPCWRQGLMQACLKEAEKYLEEVMKPVVDKSRFLAAARQAIKRGLAAIPQGVEAEELKKKLEEIEHREKKQEAEDRGDWEIVAQALLDLQKAGVKLAPEERRTLQKAAWESLYDRKSLFYQIPFTRGPVWFKSIIGSLAGLIEALLLVELVPGIATFSAPIYALLVALNIGLVKALGRQSATNIFAVHFIAGGAAAGFFWLITSIMGFQVFPPLRFLSYVILIVMVATPLASAVYLEMSFTRGKARTGIVNGVYTLIGGIVCALLGGVLGVWLSNANILSLPFAAYLGLGVGWVLVSLIMEIGDPATYGVDPDDVQFILKEVKK